MFVHGNLSVWGIYGDFLSARNPHVNQKDGTHEEQTEDSGHLNAVSIRRSSLTEEVRKRCFWRAIVPMFWPLKAIHAKLRRSEMNAIMTNFELDSAEPHGPRKWEGLSEIDQAIRDNRLTEYRIKKSWADPWSRALSIAVMVILAAFAGFVIYWDALKG